MTVPVLTLPGIYGSGAGHWQTLWDAGLPGCRRVEQIDWVTPRRRDWIATLDAAVAACEEGPVLAAHSLGCILIAWWCQSGSAQVARVRGALMVAPPDLARTPRLREVEDFAPTPLARLPIAGHLIVSANDPWCSEEVGIELGRAWGVSIEQIGAYGHVNAESGLGHWQEGLDRMRPWGVVQTLDSRSP